MMFGDPFVVLTKIGAVEIDVTLNEDHVYDSYVTENPVEDGTVYADHVVLLPTVIQMVGRVTDASLAIIGVPKLNKSIDAYQYLVELQRKKQPFSVVTGLTNYENILLRTLSVPRVAEDGQSLRFDMKLQEVLIIGTESQTNRERITESLRHTAVDPVDLGQVATI